MQLALIKITKVVHQLGLGSDAMSKVIQLQTLLKLDLPRLGLLNIYDRNVYC